MNVGAARPGVNRHLKLWLSLPSDWVIDRQLPAARRLDRLGIDQDEGEDAGRAAVVDSGVHRAALHADVARFHMHGLAVASSSSKSHSPLSRIA
jgi:hypothetical protein